MFELLTIADELHGSVLRVLTTSSAEPIASGSEMKDLSSFRDCTF